ncbi:DUF2243 domain-containing protein [Thermithiobacillus tepidarius DSM 3134]|uniref:DUF2243 domain-containing protein n=1 Tax=Thermithiobacillus tepidarius TaxID=929 RepID=UPI00042187A8|nr:DUF2243 domain-containing protein [Thermithiobacillus tepidarius]
MDQLQLRKRAATAAVLMGIGLGGFVDGIMLHQVLQWHNMLSSVLPPVNMAHMKVNMLADGLFHAASWLVTAWGIFLLWSVARQPVALPPTRWFMGLLAMGWGFFNLVEGLIDHQLLGIHHVKYAGNMHWDAPLMAWDYGFLVFGGLALIALGWLLARRSGPEAVYAGRD